VKWETGRLIVRRSHTIGTRVMKTTKQRTHYSISLPAAVIDALKWHVDTQLRRTEQQSSDLLFPSEVGSFRARSVLDKPFAAVAEMMSLGFTVTPRAMRRTFQDVARAVKLEDIVTRSICGHATERMQRHYSTVDGGEQRAALAQVIQLFGASTGDCAPTCAPTADTCAPDR
jgi:integrase